MEKRWNWQNPHWPHFTYDAAELAPLEREFIHGTGHLTGSIKHFDDEDRSLFTVQMMVDEGQKNSEIEGEYLDRESLQSSIRKKLGLAINTHRRSTPAEAGMADLMISLRNRFAESLSHRELFDWHSMICNGRHDLDVIGGYRAHDDPMQIVSPRLDTPEPRAYFEAPASAVMEREMTQFLSWFNSSAPSRAPRGSVNELPPLTRAGVAHFYFLCIHPFEDGNGRIARAISEKAISQDSGHPTLIALSRSIEAGKSQYYAMLEAHNHTLELTRWLLYFCSVVLEAQAASQASVEFLIAKTKFYNRHANEMNVRQAKVISRLFDAGPNGFERGLSAKNYQSIAKTSSATATRDLRELVSRHILRRTGERKSTRYWLEMIANGL